MRTLTAALTALALTLGVATVAPAFGDRAPEFTHHDQRDWFNSAPLSLREDLRGQVVLIDFWTYSCWNCYAPFRLRQKTPAQKITPIPPAKPPAGRRSG